MGKLTSTKARKILEDKTVRGHPLSPKQKRFIGWVAGGRKSRSRAVRSRGRRRHG